MKKILLLTSLFMLLVGCSSTGTFLMPGIQTEYDKFNDLTKYTSNESRAYTGGMLDFHIVMIEAVAMCEGQEKCQPETIYFNFESESDGWRFLDYYPITFLINGERYHFSESDVSANRNVIYGGNVREILGFYSDKDFLYALAFSTSVECKIGAYEFEIDHSRRESMRILYQDLYPS